MYLFIILQKKGSSISLVTRGGTSVCICPCDGSYFQYAKYLPRLLCFNYVIFFHHPVFFVNYSHINPLFYNIHSPTNPLVCMCICIKLLVWCQ